MLVYYSSWPSAPGETNEELLPLELHGADPEQQADAQGAVIQCCGQQFKDRLAEAAKAKTKEHQEEATMLPAASLHWRALIIQNCLSSPEILLSRQI